MLTDALSIPVEAINRAAGRAEVVEAMCEFYREVDARVLARQAVCCNRGLCCRFGEYGHRLFVTTLEVAHYLAQGPAAMPAQESVCPHAVQGRCVARERRPMGCRIFYCDPAAQDWQGPLTEELLGKLRRLHEQLDVPYYYMEWLGVLRALAAASPVKQST